MTSRPPPLIHIGYHKTATTYLQNTVFASKDLFSAPWGTQSGPAVEHFVLAHPERFDPAQIRADFYAGYDSGGPGVPVISHEQLSGDPMYGAYYLDRVAGRIRDCFPEARILIGVREQKSAILSLYYQYIRQGGTRHLQDMLVASRDGPGFRPVIRLDHFEYDLTIATYQRLFSPENVCALPMELLYRAPDDYARILGRFAGLSEPMPLPRQVVNAARTATSMRVERLLNGWINVPDLRAETYSDNPLSFRLKNRALRYLDQGLLAVAGKPHRKYLSDTVSAVVGPAFAQSNQRLSALTGYDLAALGYDCGAAVRSQDRSAS